MGFHVASVHAALLADISLELLGLISFKNCVNKMFRYCILHKTKISIQYIIFKTLFYELNDNVVYFVMQKS